MNAALTLLSFLAVTLVGSAHAAPAWWSPLPLVAGPGMGSETLAFIENAPVRPDLFEPLWAERSHLAQMNEAFGDPDEASGRGSTWFFQSAYVRVDEERPGLTIIELGTMYEPNPRTFDPSRVALGAYIAGATSCHAGLTTYGRPSSTSGEDVFSWFTLGRGRDVSLELACSPAYSRVQITLTQLPAEMLAQLSRQHPAVTLPKTFMPAHSDKAIDPRPLWPRGIAPGQPRHAVIAALGTPSDYAPDTHAAFWGKSLMVEFGTQGVVTGVTVGSHHAELAKRYGLASPLYASIGAPIASITKLLGRPIMTGDEPDMVWYWDAGEAELSIEASIRDGIVTNLHFGWLPPVERAALECREALAAAPTQPTPGKPYVAPATKRSMSQLLPFGLWFGATPRDVFDRVGLPRSCTPKVMQYRGIGFGFEQGKLDRVHITPDLFSAQVRGRSDPLVALVVAGEDAFLEAFGATPDGPLGRVFERGPEHVRVLSSYDAKGLFTGATMYIASLEPGFDFDRIHGLDLADLDASAKALDVASIIIDGSEFRMTKVQIPLAAKPALAGRVSGRFIDLLGASWTTIVAALGSPSRGKATATELTLEWSWFNDPLERTIGYRCSGETPTCHTLLVGARTQSP